MFGIDNTIDVIPLIHSRSTVSNLRDLAPLGLLRLSKMLALLRE